MGSLRSLRTKKLERVLLVGGVGLPLKEPEGDQTQAGRARSDRC